MMQNQTVNPVRSGGNLDGNTRTSYLLLTRIALRYPKSNQVDANLLRKALDKFGKYKTASEGQKKEIANRAQNSLGRFLETEYGADAAELEHKKDFAFVQYCEKEKSKIKEEVNAAIKRRGLSGDFDSRGYTLRVVQEDSLQSRIYSKISKYATKIQVDSNNPLGLVSAMAGTLVSTAVGIVVCIFLPQNIAEGNTFSAILSLAVVIFAIGSLVDRYIKKTSAFAKIKELAKSMHRAIERAVNRNDSTFQSSETVEE